MAASETPITEDFELTPSTQKWLATEYPQLDEYKTVQAFIEWAFNQKDNNKRSATYGKPLECVNWQMKFRNVIRIQMVNNWSTIAQPKSGQEINPLWQEVLAHAKAIGCPLERRPVDTVEGFRTRVKSWELHDKPKKVIDIGLKRFGS